MTTKLIALYRRPDDLEAFMTHYQQVHMPLVRQIPGLIEAKISRVDKALIGGEPDYVLIAEMVFADRPDFDAAMASPENRAAGKDLVGFAKGLVTLLVAEGD
jgi:uncharacterized protein (TIGR02118 family)